MIPSLVTSRRRRDLRNHSVCDNIGAYGLTSIHCLILSLESGNHTRLGHHIHNRTRSCASGETTEYVDTGAAGLAYLIDPLVHVLHRRPVRRDIRSEQNPSGAPHLAGRHAKGADAFLHNLRVSDHTFQAWVA